MKRLLSAIFVFVAASAFGAEGTHRYMAALYSCAGDDEAAEKAFRAARYLAEAETELLDIDEMRKILVLTLLAQNNPTCARRLSDRIAES